MKLFKNSKIILISIMIYGVMVSCYNANLTKNNKKNILTFNKNYDARLFLSEEQIDTFKFYYHDFTSSDMLNKWEWEDVDPLKLLTPFENRFRRRIQFIVEYSPGILPNNERLPSEEQSQFNSKIKIKFKDSIVSMTDKTLKISMTYNPHYDVYFNSDFNKKIAIKLLEITAKYGLEWQKLNGNTLLIYNGPILISKYYNGNVILIDQKIDEPIFNGVKNE